MEKQLIDALNKIRSDLADGKITSNSQLALKIKNAVDVSYKQAVLPEFFSGETPNSDKVNDLIHKLEIILSDREYIFDILLAASIYDYNTAICMLDDLMDRVLSIQDSVKTLNFFSKPAVANKHVVNTDFREGWGIFNSSTKTLERSYGSGLTLPIQNKKASTGKFVITGNGQAGNWFVLNEDGSLFADISPNDNPEHAFDGVATTQFDYQNIKISQDIYDETKGYGFGYDDSLYKWASPETSKVELQVEINLDKVQTINYIIVVPSSQASEFVIESITLSLNGVETKTLSPRDLTVNQELSMLGENGYCNFASYGFEPTLTDAINIKIKSIKPTPCMIKHVYAVDEQGERITTLSPSVKYPHGVIESVFEDSETHKLETLPADRYLISVKDILPQTITFQPSATVTSDVVRFSRPIDRIALKVDQTLMDESSVSYSVSLDEGKTWYYINPLGAAISDQVIAVNDLVPDAYKDPSTKYITAQGNPNSVILRIAMERNSGHPNVSPILRTIELEATTK